MLPPNHSNWPLATRTVCPFQMSSVRAVEPGLNLLEWNLSKYWINSQDWKLCACGCDFSVPGFQRDQVAVKNSCDIFKDYILQHIYNTEMPHETFQKHSCLGKKYMNTCNYVLRSSFIFCERHDLQMCHVKDTKPPVLQLSENLLLHWYPKHRRPRRHIILHVWFFMATQT